MDCILRIDTQNLREPPQKKMSAALQSTGRAVFLSAMTTIIGFISLKICSNEAHSDCWMGVGRGHCRSVHPHHDNGPQSYNSF
ncbi:MAG: hypothetical protein Ct9H90mP26_0890 [Methanobacteriota archaeon]|nr:MAG: hypothetical protein Ct9H90mP26_0890 [Euryarchaeota archaeon]